jgi:hypothetical protein
MAGEKDTFATTKGGYYESGKYDTSGDGKILSGGVPAYQRAIEQAGGPRAVKRADKLLSGIDAIKGTFATGRIGEENKREGRRGFTKQKEKMNDEPLPAREQWQKQDDIRRKDYGKLTPKWKAIGTYHSDGPDTDKRYTRTDSHSRDLQEGSIFSEETRAELRGIRERLRRSISQGRTA